MEYSKNERAKKVCGLRGEGTSFDYPIEFGFKCPKRKIHNLDWSEYKFFLWCEKCNYDYPSPLCLKDIKKATSIYLDILEGIKNVPNKKEKS